MIDAGLALLADAYAIDSGARCHYADSQMLTPFRRHAAYAYLFI
jgi:hypothetical protein